MRARSGPGSFGQWSSSQAKPRSTKGERTPESATVQSYQARVRATLRCSGVGPAAISVGREEEAETSPRRFCDGVQFGEDVDGRLPAWCGAAPSVASESQLLPNV